MSTADTTCIDVPDVSRSTLLNAEAPRYRRLADALLRDIGAGKYKVGTLLPPEVQLSRHYGVSRHTVREAIRRLSDMGLVSRQQGIGTRVRARHARARFIATITSISDLFQYTQRTRLSVLAARTVNASEGLAELLRCKTGQRWLRFETCRYPIGAETPISYTEIYVHAAYEGIRNKLGGEGVWVYGLIEEHYGERIVELQQEVSSLATPVRIARLLRAKPRAPALRVLRYYYGGEERLLSVSVNVYPENRFTFSTRWRLEWDRR